MPNIRPRGIFKLMTKKAIHIIAGPNGSGKTTFAYSFLLPRSNGNFFINADTVAAGLSPNHSESAAFQAGRFVLEEIKKAIADGRSFCFESTLSGLTWQGILRHAKKDGYSIFIYFVFVNQTSISAARIKQRVKEGGHNIPLNVLRRRTPRSFANFWNVYRHFADDWYLFDNSTTQSSLWCSRLQYEQLSPSKKIKIDVFFSKKSAVRKAK